MSQSYRQSELFAGSDWTVLYRAFTEINFNASDPTSINTALREYIRQNYPEDFNDWIESSEFVAIIDLLSWLAGTLAFKTDIAARENFLETAESRESILRLARFLSYNPQRNQPARGLVKLVQVETDDDITDAYGVSLNNTPVVWDDPEDSDWFERFILIMNNAFVKNNPFGTPLRSGTVSDTRTQLYRVNTQMSDNDFTYGAQVSGESMDFEIVNADFEDNSGFIERTPNPNSAFHVLYRNDGNGNTSSRTGFFLLFKQGTTKKESFNITTPIENLLLDISSTNVNESDVWVQTVEDDGTVLSTWEPVPAIFSENITFNSIDADIRNIYSVVTRDEDRISIRFSDGRFGAAPVGNVRVTYRVSNGLSYQIRPQEMDRISIPMTYYNRAGVKRTITFTFSLQEAVTNSSPRETDAQIQQRAPAVYATQNRMVSGEDYNTFPLQGNNSVKLKAVNRVYSGHSRYIDLNDPTGNFQDTSVFSDDGLFYKEPYNSYTEVPLSLNRTPAEIASIYIQPMLESQSATNYVRDIIMTAWENGDIPALTGVTWVQSTDSNYGETGWLNGATNSDIWHLHPGALMLVAENGNQRWVGVADVNGSAINGNYSTGIGAVTLSDNIANGASILGILPRYAAIMTSDTVATIIQCVNDNKSFTLWYDYNSYSSNTDINAHWVVEKSATNLMLDAQSGTLIKILTANYVNGGIWRLSAKGMRFIFESKRNVQWYFEGERAVNEQTGVEQADMVRIMKLNEDLKTGTGRGLGKDYELAIDGMYYYGDGYSDPRRCVVTLNDSDQDGFEDAPDTYLNVISPEPKDTYLFWHRALTDIDPVGVFEPFYDMVVYPSYNDRVGDVAAPVGTIAYQITGSSLASNNTFWMLTGNGWVEQPHTSYKVARGRGPNVAIRWLDNGVSYSPLGSTINFHWKHYAPSDHRIDPASTNIMDIFVLTTEYDFRTRQWIANGAKLSEIPVPPTELDLRLAYSEFDDYKMFSDELVWRPVKYKYLFGNGALPELRTQFKVVKLLNTTLSDGEIKSRVVRAINDYFDVTLWDFGETFYFTELAAYVHQQLANVIGSFVIVPMDDDASFGDGFEVHCRADELFISTAQVTDVSIINANTATNLRIK